MDKVKIKGVPRWRLRPRTLLTALLVVAIVAVAWTQRATVVSVVQAMTQGAVPAIVAALVFESVRILFHAAAYTRSFRLIGADVPLSATVPAWFKAVFMNTVLPSGGTSGMAAVVDSARSRGVAVGSATTATLYTQTCYYSSIFLVVVVGFVVMARTGGLDVGTVLIGSIMGVAALAFVGLLAMGHYAAGTLQRFMRWAERLVVRVCGALRLKKAPQPWADALVRSFSGAATELSRHPKQALAVFAVMVAAMVFDMLAFVASGVAFGIVRPDALFAGYVTAIVFNSFNVTPGGVGIVEGLASAVLAGYGYPVALCVSAVLVYRAAMYWIPFVVGGVMMHVTGAFGASRAASPTEGEPAGSETARDRMVGAAAAVVDRMAEEEAPVYVRRRRSDVSFRERVLAFVRDKVELRTAVSAALLALCGVVGLAAAALPADPVTVAAITTHVAQRIPPLNPVAMVVFSYLLLVLVPGILIHDQGNWLMAFVGLLCLGISTALAGRSVWVMLLVVAVLVVLVLWHRCFEEHGFLLSLRRLLAVLVYALLLAVGYALVGSLFIRGDLVPDPGIGGALWMGLQALVARPSLPGVVVGPQAAWFFMSVWAITVMLSLIVGYVVVRVAIRRIAGWCRPERRRARAVSRAESSAAAAERRAARRERWLGRWDVLVARVRMFLGRDGDDEGGDGRR